MMRKLQRTSWHPTARLGRARNRLVALLALLLLSSPLLEFDSADASHGHAHGSAHAAQAGGWILELDHHGPHRAPQLESVALHRHELCAVCVNQLQSTGTSVGARAAGIILAGSKASLPGALTPPQSCAARLRKARAPPLV